MQQSSFLFIIIGIVVSFMTGCGTYFDPVSGFWEEDAANPAFPATATAITPNGSSISGYLQAGSKDWYSFQALNGFTYTIATSGYTDTRLRLYDSTRTTLIYSDDNSGTDYNALIVWACYSSKLYCFEVSGYSSSTTGSYAVSVTAY